MKEFEILFVSKTENEYLTAEILFRGQRLCQISKEKGNEEMEIEFLVDTYILQEKIIMKFSLAEFENTIFKAKNELKLCN